jgi:hypothetical protein
VKCGNAAPGRIITTYYDRDVNGIPAATVPPNDMRPRSPDRKAIKAKRKAAARNRRRR